ncbi:MAG: cytochrome c3 family protein [Bacteroidota bacterium]
MIKRNHLRSALTGFVLCFLLAGFQEANAQSAGECLSCHNEPSLTTVKKGKTVSLYVDAKRYSASVHGSLDCVSCHEGFNPAEIPHVKKLKPVNCLTCHTDEQFEHYKQSVHAQMKHGKANATCADCHSKHEIRDLTNASAVQKKAFAEETCARCHPDVDSTYRTSEHGMAVAEGVMGAPTCIDCHDDHNVRASSDTASMTYRKNVAAMCLNCHMDDPAVRAKVGLSTAFIGGYENSVHGRAMKNGHEEAATCTDCHGTHDLKKGSDPTSRVSRRNIAGTCGTCHGEIKDEYESSIHGKALANGVNAAATCTDCHGEHNILSPKDANAPVAPKNVSAQVCSPCHSSVKLTSKFGLATDRFKSFADSYHGLANEAGSVVVANCASCHGVHNIKPSTDSTSTVYPGNLAKTCGKCHPGANKNFAKGAVHVMASDSKEEILYFVSSTYIILIIVTIGGMLFHNIVDFLRKSRHILAIRRGDIPFEKVPHRLYLRMSLNERFQHGALLLSFLTLVTTGFALRFPDAWWVVPLRNISPLMFEIRGIIHRIAAVMMVAASLYHIYYVLYVPRGKQLLRDLVPVSQDVKDAVGVVLYNLGIRDEKPRLGRFCYVEKSEYWALVWGTAVMTVTGVILWFDNTFLGILTKLWWDVARTIHYYEAWLATLAILVWHFYFVIFNPDSYPLNLAFWKGTLTEKEMADEHPLELEQIKEQEKAQLLAEKAAESAERE